MPRFYVPPSDIQDQRFRLAGSEARHALQVLRKRVGDEIDLFDGKDHAYRGRIDAVAHEALTGTIVATLEAADRGADIWLFAALIKGPRWDWLVQKACEVGVDVLVPLQTERTVIDLDGKETTGKVERWNRIALEAAKQCGRHAAMQVLSPQSFADSLKNAVDLRLFPWEKEGQRNLRDACADFSGSRIGLWIGPEGGWDQREVEQATAQGAVPVTLGPLLLRSETAGIVAAAIVAHELATHRPKC